MMERGKTRDELMLESVLLRKRLEELRAAELSCVRAERALQDEERFLENILDSIQDGVSVLDKNMNIIRVNPAMEKWYSHAMPLVGKKCYQAYHSRTSPCEICPTQKTFKTGKAAYEVVPKRGPKGAVTGWLDLYSFPLIDSKTGKTEGVIEYVRDITERKKTEDALKASEVNLAFAQEVAQIGSWSFDLKTGIVSWSDALFRIFGLDPKKGAPQWPDGQRKLFHPRDWKWASRLISDAIAKGESYDIYDRFYKPDGSIGWAHVVGRPFAGPDGKIERFVGTLQDVTERKMAEEKLAELNKELMESNRKLKDFSLIDPQTGLYNHRYLAEAIETEFYRARRYSYPLSMAMMDIDYFKSINDLYGHRFGDRVLREFTSQLKKAVRRYDTIVRYGGEEFVIIAPSTEKYRIRILAGRIQAAINSCDFGDKKQKVRLKVTIAVSSYPEDIDIGKGMDLVSFTERILNKAKQAGGNRIFTTEDAAISGRGKHHAPAGRENREVKGLKERIEKLTKSGNESVTEAIVAFARTIEAKDHYTAAHTEKTVRYAVSIAKAFGFPKEEILNIEKAAILHDLGKIGVSEKILCKKGALTPKEYREIKKHPRIGADILRSIHFMHDIVPLILYHHERWDGKGYPMKLKELEIPLGARIIAIADVFEALTSNRPYRKAYSPAKAIKIIKEGSGTQFDPRVVEKFIRIFRKERPARRKE